MNQYRPPCFAVTGALLATVFVAIGCRPSLKARSAGSVGCSPGEIVISEQDSSRVGLAEVTTTWVAECRGQRFVCSENYHSAYAETSSETHCTPERDPDANKADSASKPVAVVANKDRVAAPVGGGGFDFGTDRATAQTTCENASLTWTKLADSKFLCSGSPIDLGFPAEVVVDVCRGVVCGVTVDHRPKARWLSVFGDLKGQLDTKYGAPEPTAISVTSDCREDSQLLGCIESESVRMRYTWTWPSGERMNLFLGMGDGSAGTPAIRLQYVKAPSAIKAKASAL